MLCQEAKQVCPIPYFFFFFLLQQAVLNFLESLVSSEAGNCVCSPANFCLSGQVVNCILRILSY